MIDLVATKLSAIQDACRRYGIRSLDLVGSASTGAFDPASSDVDFIVDLGEYSPGTADRYLDLAADLERLLGRSVDLVTERSITNPYFRHETDKQRVRLYGPPDRQVAA